MPHPGEMVALYVLLCTALYYLLARAEITRPLWSRYTPGMQQLAGCPACLGFWIGVGLGIVFGWALQWSFLGLPGRHVATPFVVGLCSMVWTPLTTLAHVYALLYTSGFASDNTNPDDSHG